MLRERYEERRGCDSEGVNAERKKDVILFGLVKSFNGVIGMDCVNGGDKKEEERRGRKGREGKAEGRF